jgi:hypothetical protein
MLRGSWALGFKITAIQEAVYVISGNLNTSITTIIIKKQYDGIYHSTGNVYHPSYR